METELSVSRTGADCVIALRGAFQLKSAARLHQAAIEAAKSGAPVVIDLREAEHVDGTAAQILLALKIVVARSGGSLRLRGASDSIRQYLAWGGFGEHFQGDGAAV